MKFSTYTLSTCTTLTDSASLSASLKSCSTCQRLRRSTLKLCKIIYKPNPAMIRPMWTLWWQPTGNVSQWRSKECNRSSKCRSVVARSRNGVAVSSPAYCSVVSTWSTSWIVRQIVGPIMKSALWRNNLLRSVLSAPYKYIHQLFIYIIFSRCYENNEKYIFYLSIYV